MPYHTHLNLLLAPIANDIKSYNWLIADVEYGGFYEGALPINMEQDYFILSPEEFDVLLKADVQIWWGAVLGIPQNIDIKIDKNDLPFVEGNGSVWENGNLQHADAQIEIDCWDSGYTIVKFKDVKLSDKFCSHFSEAIELEKFF